MRHRVLAALTLTLACTGTASAAQFDISGPAGSQRFGATVTVLPNGNIVVTDPDWSSKAGAVHLYSPAGALLNTVTGNLANDSVGLDGIVVLKNGNYVIPSSAWHGVGAVTWASATSGVAGGVVSAGNSLVGTAPSDGVGQRVIALSNGNYVVGSPFWDGGFVNLGAATWGDGNGGTVGAVSASNSLVGVAINSRLGDKLTALSNGNYVVTSNFVSSRGSATWGNGNGGTVGSVSASNSLVGSVLSDQVGSTVIALSNGNYVTSAPSWDNGATADAGAVTWGNGNGGTVGAVSAANSLVGMATGDRVGAIVAALSNGNYVVGSPVWNGAATDVGAATWGNGNGGTVGAVSSANSLVGTATDDRVGYGATALSNGNYVVLSTYWNNGGATDAGAATWGNGNGSTVGAVSASNSLVGTATNDRVGTGVTALTNGNYVVGSQVWRNGGGAQAGAATWGDGNGGTVGTISPANSLVGTAANDGVGETATALSNGNYVLCARYWNNGAATSAGAATWGNGTGGTVGALSSGNSLVGTTTGDGICASGVTALSNGNYVVDSPFWNGPAFQVGAATPGDGSGGSSVGPASAGNSLTGTAAGDNVAKRATVALADGDYVVSSPEWNNAGISQAGAITFRRSWERQGATIVAENSVRGLVAGGGPFMVWGYDATRDQLAVGRPMENIVTLFTSDLDDLLFRDGFE